MLTWLGGGCQPIGSHIDSVKGLPIMRYKAILGVGIVPWSETYDGRAGLPDEATLRQALFPGLVYNEAGEAAEVVFVGGIAHYAIPDHGFLRHVEAFRVDSAVISHLKERITSMQDDVVRGMLQMLGKDDLFTKAALDASIRNLEQNIRQADSNQWVPWLRLFGFRVVVNVHGEVVDILYPTQPDRDE